MQLRWQNIWQVTPWLMATSTSEQSRSRRSKPLFGGFMMRSSMDRLSPQLIGMSAAVNMAMECKCIDKECELADVGVKDLVKFDPDDFDIHEDAFLDMLAQTHGIQGEPVHRVVHNAHVPAAFVDDAEECMCQLPLTGPSFDEDNCTVFCRLKAFLVDTPGWAWIEPCNLTENGRQAFMAWANHCNGEGELSK